MYIIVCTVLGAVLGTTGWCFELAEVATSLETGAGIGAFCGLWFGFGTFQEWEDIILDIIERD